VRQAELEHCIPPAAAALCSLGGGVRIWP
jgi:hypothetical protein